MKPDLHGPKAGVSRQNMPKMKGKVEAEESQSRILNQIKFKKGKNMKSPSTDLSKKKPPSSVKSYSKEENGDSRTKKSKEKNLDSISTKEPKSRKRKREEEQKKPKSNGTKSANGEAKHKKDKMVEANNSNSGMVSPVKSPSQKARAESRRKEHDVKPKKSKTTSAKKTATKPASSTGAKPSENSVKGSKSLKTEKGNKKLKENVTAKKLKPSGQNSKPKTSLKRGGSFPNKDAGSSRSKGQTKIAVQKKPRPNSINPSHKDVKKKMSKASGHDSTTLVEKSRVSSARRMKVMQALGLAPPVGSPFTRQEAIL